MALEETFHAMMQQHTTRLNTQRDLYLGGLGAEICAVDENEILDGLHPTTDMEHLRSRQGIMAELLADETLRVFFRKLAWDDISDSTSVIDTTQKVEIGRPPSTIKVNLPLMLPDLPVYNGENETIRTWLDVLKTTQGIHAFPGRDVACRDSIFSMARYVRDLSSPFALGAEKLKTLRDRRENSMPIRAVNFVDTKGIRILGAYPCLTIGREESKPFDIVIEPEKHPGLILVGPNGSGKSMFLDTLHNNLYTASRAGVCLASGEVEIDEIPCHVFRLRSEYPDHGDHVYPPSWYKPRGAFQKIVEGMYSELFDKYTAFDRRKDTKGRRILLIDDVLESITDSDAIEELLGNLSVLNKSEERLYTVAVLRDSDLAVRIAEKYGYQRVGITAEHGMNYGEFVDDQNGREIAKDSHRTYTVERDKRISDNERLRERSPDWHR